MNRSKGSGKDVMALVKQFLELNAARNKRDLKTDEIDRWFSLKQSIEEALFSRPPSKKDQRRSIRVSDLKLPVRYVHGVDTCEATVKEISDGGLFVASQEPLPVGARIELHVELPENIVGEAEVTVAARVIYTNQGHSFSERAFSGMGLSLDPQMSRESKDKWLRVVGALLEKTAREVA